MLALTFACRVLLIFLVSDSIQTSDRSETLISENMWPQACVLDCARGGRHRAVCGSNGRLYKSQCAFQRAQCVNQQLRTVPRLHCVDPTQSKCQLARSQALESSVRSHAAVIFVPECNADGSFQQVQCHNQTGYCWCSTRDGKPVSGTSVLHLRPNCTGHFSKLSQEMSLEEAERESTPTPDPRKPLLPSAAAMTAPPFWVTILLNSEPRVKRPAKRPTDTHHTCERERAALLAERRLLWQEERFVPECSADGRYSPFQCHITTGYCWCVRVDTGRPLPGTAIRNRLPDCSAEESQSRQPDRRLKERPLPGCPGFHSKEFLQSLVRALQLEAEPAGGAQQGAESDDGLFPLRGEDVSLSASVTPPPSMSPVGGLSWHFQQLDVDQSGVLSEREARPLRLHLRRRLKPPRCIKKFTQYCDRNQDRGLSLSELTACLQL